MPEHSSCSNTWLDADVSALMLVISPHSQLRHTPACQLLAFLSKRGRWLHSQAFLLHRGGGRTVTAVQEQIQNLEVTANSPSSIDTPTLHSSYSFPKTLAIEIPSSHSICTPVTSQSPRPCTKWIWKEGLKSPTISSVPSRLGGTMVSLGSVHGPLQFDPQPSDLLSMMGTPPPSSAPWPSQHRSCLSRHGPALQGQHSKPQQRKK